MVVAWRELHLPLFHQRASAPFIVGQPLEDQPADHRAAQGARHVIPGDGRSGVEDQIAPHSGNHIRSARNPDENGRAVQDALHSELVGFVDGHRSTPRLRDWGLGTGNCVFALVVLSP